MPGPAKLVRLVYWPKLKGVTFDDLVSVCRSLDYCIVRSSIPHISVLLTNERINGIRIVSQILTYSFEKNEYKVFRQSAQFVQLHRSHSNKKIVITKGKQIPAGS